MKSVFFLLIALCSTQLLPAQTAVSQKSSVVKFAPLDKSPLDVIYYPVNYPVLKIQDRATEPVVARLIYSRPQRNNRTIFGDLVPYNEVWRLGANEATELELFRDVKIEDKKLAKGRYTLYAIPGEKAWTIIFNRDTDTWGAFKYDESKDAMRVEIPVEKTSFQADVFSAVFAKSANGADLVFAWDDTMAVLPFSFR